MKKAAFISIKLILHFVCCGQDSLLFFLYQCRYFINEPEIQKNNQQRKSIKKQNISRILESMRKILEMKTFYGWHKRKIGIIGKNICKMKKEEFSFLTLPMENGNWDSLKLPGKLNYFCRQIDGGIVKVINNYYSQQLSQ